MTFERKKMVFTVLLCAVGIMALVLNNNYDVEM